MGEEEKKEVFQCQVCGRIHRRAEGKCFCGADLEIFGKWVAEPKPKGPNIDPDIIKKPDEETKKKQEDEKESRGNSYHGKENEEIKEDPAGKKKKREKKADKKKKIKEPKKPGRKLAKAAGTLVFILVFALVSVLVSEWLDTGGDSRTVSREERESTSGGWEDPADASGDTLEDEESEIPQDTPEPDEPEQGQDPTITSMPEEETEEGSEESGVDTSLSGMICNETENAIYNIFMYPESSDEGYDVLGNENILLDGSRQEIPALISGEDSYDLMVLNDAGAVFSFWDVIFGENDGLTLSERDGAPLLTVTKASGETISAKGDNYQYRDVYSDFTWMKVPICNDTRYDFSELYVYDSGTEDRGTNLIELWLEDDVLNPYDNFKIIAEWDTPKDVYFLDTEGDIWLYESVDFSGAFCIYNRLNEEGQPELVLVYSDPIDSEDDFMVVSGGLWEG